MNTTDKQKQISRLLKKCDIKDANGIDSSEELTTALQIMAENSASQEEIDAYKMTNKELALSLLDEPLSDIPMGQVIQFVKLVKREYDTFKQAVNRNENVCNQFKRFNAVSEYLDDIIAGLSDEGEFIETPELNTIGVEFIDLDENSDAELCLNEIKNKFEYSDAVIRLLEQGVTDNNIPLMSVTSFYLTIVTLYLHYIIEQLELSETMDSIKKINEAEYVVLNIYDRWTIHVDKKKKEIFQEDQRHINLYNECKNISNEDDKIGSLFYCIAQSRLTNSQYDIWEKYLKIQVAYSPKL